MKPYYFLFLFLLLIGVYQLVNAQTESTVRRQAQGKVVNQDEMVSFKADVPYTKAIQALGELSKKLDGKLVIDRSPLQGKEKPIGINIESMYWKDALELILRSNQLWYNDYPEYMEIVTFEEVGKPSGQVVSGGTTKTPSDMGPGSKMTTSIDSSEYYSQVHEINISSIFFDVNKTKLTESGMNFSIFRGHGLNLQANLTGADIVSKELFTLGIQPTGNNIPVTMDALISVFSEDNFADIIARPQITVRSGSTSMFQVGADFSILEKDFSGNTVQRFYPTGTILTVRPKIWKVGDMQFIDILYKVEKSTFTTGPSTTVINKTTASGSLTLLDGEEGYIGGMYSNEETIVRSGIPLLKDLPWWFFGLRYLFGYDKKETIKRELIVLIKAEILPSVEERVLKPKVARDLIKEGVEDMEKDLNKRKQN
jgi:general secretion pathway protein D